MNRFKFIFAASLAVWCLAWSQAELSPQPQAATQSAAAAVSGLARDSTALCHDNTWSSAKNRQGACSGHGGIKTWFGKAPKNATARCKDGTYSKSSTAQG